MRSDHVGARLILVFGLILFSAAAQAAKPKPGGVLDAAIAAELPPEAAVALLRLDAGSPVRYGGAAWAGCGEQLDGVHFPATQTPTLFGVAREEAALRPWSDIEFNGGGAFGAYTYFLSSRSGKNKYCQMMNWHRVKAKHVLQAPQYLQDPEAAADSEWLVRTSYGRPYLTAEAGREAFGRVITALSALGVDIPRKLDDSD